MKEPWFVAVVVCIVLFAAALLGTLQRQKLPGHHLTDETKDSVRIGMGSVATMAALVLGLLVASTKGAYDNERNQLIQISAKIVYLDQLLANYGQEAAGCRAVVRRATQSAILNIWPETNVLDGTPAPGDIWSQELPKTIQALSPQTDAQRAFKLQAAELAKELGQARWLLFEETESSISTWLLVIMVFWLALVFVSVGLVGPVNATAILAQLLAAFSIAGAVFLILELDLPFDGLVKISSKPMLNALNHLAK